MKPFDVPSGTADTIGRVLMALCGFAAAYAMGTAFAQGAAQSWVELWRAIGFGTFALIFFVLALRPRRSPFLWEVAFLNKTALAVAWLVLPNLAEASEAGPVDAGIAVAVLASYVLTRAWQGWLR